MLNSAAPGHLAGTNQISQFRVADRALTLLAVEGVVLQRPGREGAGITLADEGTPEIGMWALGLHG